MPDVSRSDSQRSTDSVPLRPRVSFNRDVHVKRIEGGGAGPVRKERLAGRRGRKEAERAYSQADKLSCTAYSNGVAPEKFYTLPTRKKKRGSGSGSDLSLDRALLKRRTEENAPKKPPRTFAFVPQKDGTKSPSSLLGFLKKPTEKKSSLRRSVSDVTDSKRPRENVKGLVGEHQPRRRSGSESEENLGAFRTKKTQLSPIIELAQREDYFSGKPQEPVEEGSDTNKENDGPVVKLKAPSRKKWTNDPIYVPSDVKVKSSPEVVVIDVDKAQKISGKKDLRKKLLQSTDLISKKFRSLTRKKEPAPPPPPPSQPPKEKTYEAPERINSPEKLSTSPKIKEAIQNLKNRQISESPKMIHSSQQPPDKLPLTRGQKVDSLVRRLSSDTYSPPPPKSSILVTPSVTVQHNNNQPFSYTKPRNPSPTRPVIYAHVVSKEGSDKRTVHAAYANGRKHVPHSDSDEGLGYEESFGKGSGRSADFYRNIDRFDEEFPITPTLKASNGFGYDAKLNGYTKYSDSSKRGRADGMDSKRRESLTEPEHGPVRLNGGYPGQNLRKDLSYRRELLESRINSRGLGTRTSPESYPKAAPTRYLSEVKTPSPTTQGKYVSESTTRYYRHRSSSPVGLTERFTAESKVEQNGERTKTKFNEERKYLDYYGRDEPRSLESDCRSSPENSSRTRPHSHMNKYRSKAEKSLMSKDRDVYRSNPEIARYQQQPDDRYVAAAYHDSLRRQVKRRSSERRTEDESEDEGFASSLLISSERQHADAPYAPRERSIDDGSHYDPRIDKLEQRAKRVDHKPPKPEKKSGLEKVKQLFSRDSRKTKKNAERNLAREESLRARYTEYRGSEAGQARDYSARRRLSTPSPTPQNGRSSAKTESTHSSWFKSLDRLSRKKNKDQRAVKSDKEASTEEEGPKPPRVKSLRFFGDTDAESNGSVRMKPALKPYASSTLSKDRIRSQSTKDLHSAGAELRSSKSLQNINETGRVSVKPPASPANRTFISNRKDDLRSRRKKNEGSSVESSTEGDSSQQSQRSIVYLHAATVGDIPGPRQRRAASREELNSQPQVKTLSRSFSVLAPWKPRHYREGYDIDYTQYPPASAKTNGRFKAKDDSSSSTLLKKKRSTGDLHKAKSKESLSYRPSTDSGRSSTLYKKKDRALKENVSRYGQERRMTSKSASVESLKHRESKEKELSRSVSMPRSADKPAGWFKMKGKKSASTQRL